MPALKNLQYFFTDKTFSISNGVQAALRMPHNKFLWVAGIYHAPGILTLHSKSPSQLLTTSPNKQSLHNQITKYYPNYMWRLRHNGGKMIHPWPPGRSVTKSATEASPGVLTLHTLLSQQH